MRRNNLIGLVGATVALFLVSALIVSAFTGASRNDGRDRYKGGSETEFDADVEQTCYVHVEMSEVKRSDVCNPDARISQSDYDKWRKQHHDVEYKSDIEQKCKVYIEMSKVKDTDFCNADATTDQNSKSKGGHDGKDHDYDKDRDHDGRDGGHDGKDRDYDKDWDHDGKDRDHDGDRDHKSGAKVEIDNQEKTTCEAESYLLAINQCDVGGDASAFTEGDGRYGATGGASYDGYGGKHGSRGSVDIENQEKTTCEAEAGLVALNQCDVDDDASAFGGLFGDSKGGLGGGLLGGLGGLSLLFASLMG